MILVAKNAFEAYFISSALSRSVDRIGVSDKFNGLNSLAAKEKIVEYGISEGWAKHKVQYKLRDWLFSRQRYWGEPIPIVHKGEETVAIDENELPLELPEVDKYEPSGTGESPLANIKEWVEIKDSNNEIIALRETNTMPQWAGSCWYYLRFIDPKNDKMAWDNDKENTGCQLIYILEALNMQYYTYYIRGFGIMYCTI